MDRARFTTPCPLCAVPVELPAADVAHGGKVTLRTEPLFDHVAEQHGPPVLSWLDLSTGDLVVSLAPVHEGRHATLLVEQRELTDPRTATETT